MYLKQAVFTAFLVLSAQLIGMTVSRAASKDCRTISNSVDKVLCSDPEFSRADQAMSASYFDLLRSITDREMRDAIIFSQKRWVKAREAGVVNVDDTPVGDRPELERRRLIEVTRDRALQLRRKTGDGRTAAMVATMLDQKKIMASFAGGPFQGFSTECEFVSPPFGSGYLCVGTVAVQTGRRVCAHSLEWASGHETDIQVVATVDGNRLQQDAMCKFGYDGNYPTCPHPDRSWVEPASHRPLSVQLDEDGRSRDRPMGWERPGSYDLDLDRHPLRALDPEGDNLDRNVAFLRTCTSTPEFPHRSIRKSIAPALKSGDSQDR